MTDLAAYVLRSAVFLAVFYSLYRLALSRETCFALNRAYLLGAAALSLALPLVRVPSPFFVTVIDAAALPAGAGEVPAASAAAARGLGLPEALTAVYVAGAGLMVLLFLVRLGRLALLVGRCGCVRHSGLRVVLCGHPGESFSFFGFVFLNRTDVPAADLDRVLAHELAHVRQLHSLDVVLAELLAAVQWFNPLVWPYKRSLRETHEYLADRAVIAQGCSLARYQLLIVEQHVGGRLLELASSFRTSQIKRRIVMLSKQETKGLARWKPLLILPLALGLVLAFAESRTVVKEGPSLAAQAAGQESKAQAATAGPSEEEMIKAIKEKSLQLEDMKKKNEETMAKLKQKLAEAPDEAAQAKIKAAMQDQKVLALQIGAKERMLQAKKAEIALNRETDPAKKAEIEQKLKQLQTEIQEHQKKAEALGGKKDAEKVALEKKEQEKKLQEKKAEKK